MRVIIPAAGRGTRLSTSPAAPPKALFRVGGRPLLETVLEQTNFIAPSDTYIVVGYKGEEIVSYFGSGYHYVEQREQLGTGHAVQQCAEAFRGYEGTVLVTFGDMPLFRRESMRAMCELLERERAACVLLTAQTDQYPLWARIVRGDDGRFQRIVEGKDCTAEQARLTELFAGVLAFDSKLLFEYLPRLDANNVQHEYYLTEVPELMARDGLRVETLPTDEPDDLRGVNTRADVAVCEEILSRRAPSRSRYPDIYFEPNYAKLYENADNRAVEYQFECDYGVITNLFLKRKIDIALGDGVQYYDIITPYGYGGPLIHEATDRERLVAAYMADFQRYAQREKIVAEFVRFHPLVQNALDFKDAYRAFLDRKTVGTNLTYEDVIGTEFSRHKRKDINKILKTPGIRYEVDEHPSTLDDFLPIYYATMDRDQAATYYYFDQSYFRAMLRNLPEHITTGKVFLGDKLIAMGVYFRYGEFLHAHLSGTLSEYLSYSPAALLKYALAIYGHDRGYKVIHYGGGSSRSEENGLYQYKHDFGLHTTFDFYLAKKVWDADAYQRICAAVGADPCAEFFPAYRAGR